MDQEVEIISSETRKEKIINFIKNKKKIIIFFIFFIIFIIFIINIIYYYYFYDWKY